MMQALKFGFELEMGTGGRDYHPVARLLVDRGLATDITQCNPHCQCNKCRYDRKHGLLTVQRDSGVAAEFVSRILSTRSVQDRKEMKELQAVYPEMLEAMNWRPDGHFGAGNHCHVGWPDRICTVNRWGQRYPHSRIGARVTTLLSSLFAADVERWQRIADGGCGRHRPYNGACTVNSWGGFNGSWLADRGHGTLEFRVWNTPLDAKRLMVHPAISVALMTWALQLVDEHSHLPTFDSAQRCAEYVRGRELIERKRVIGLIREIWQDKPSARLAAELVAA